MTSHAPTVFLVDDDPGVLKALTTLLTVSGYDVKPFGGAQEFLEHHDASLPGCAVFDVAMPDIDGLELQAALLEKHLDRPVIFITGFGDVPTSVRAMKAGAVDFIIKPVVDQQLLEAVAQAVQRDAEARKAADELKSIGASLARLTPRELEVLTHVIAGKLNKQIAHELGTVVNTVKVHRGRAMRKLGATSVAELVRVAQRAGVQPAAGAKRRPAAWLKG
jgi:FixJ family two-component response regulator